MATIQYEYREIPDLDTGDSNILASGKLLKIASKTTAITGDTHTADPVYYDDKELRHRFVFWNVSFAPLNVPMQLCNAPRLFSGFTVTGTTLKLETTPPSDLVATAWYIREDLGDPDIVGTGGTTSARALAFDRGPNRFLRESPIESVSPPSAWAGGDAHDVTTTDRRTEVIAKSFLQTENRSHGGALWESIDELRFSHWVYKQHDGSGSALPLDRWAVGKAIAVYRRVVAVRRFNIEVMFKPLRVRPVELPDLRPAPLPTDGRINPGKA